MESEAVSVISCILIGPGLRKRDRKTVSAVRFGPSASRPAMPALRSIATGPRLSSIVSRGRQAVRSEEHTSELQSLMRISYAVFCLKKKTILITDIEYETFMKP